MAMLEAVKAKVWLFHLRFSALTRRSLSRNVLREICSYFEDPQYFVAIDSHRMHLYNFSTHEITEYEIPLYVISGFIQVDRTTVLIVGEKVMTLDVLSLQVTPQAPLLNPRNFVGVIQVGKTVYAFGGDFPEVTFCEKSNVLHIDWTPLPPMNYASKALTPCVYKDLIYLVSITYSNHSAIETFNIHTETFAVVPVSFTEHIEAYWNLVTFVANGELIILTQYRFFAWKIESESGFRKGHTPRECQSYRAPLVVGTKVYISVRGYVDIWNLETMKYMKTSKYQIRE